MSWFSNKYLENWFLWGVKNKVKVFQVHRVIRRLKISAIRKRIWYVVFDGLYNDIDLRQTVLKIKYSYDVNWAWIIR